MRRFLPLLCVALLAVARPVAASPAGSSGDARDAWWSDGVTASLDRAGERRDVWTAALHTVPAAQRVGFAFLLEHMPSADLEQLDPAFVLENVALAYAAREAVPWGKTIPEAVFLNDVLPYASISESRDPWRAEFMEQFLPVVAECTTPGEAAHVLNQHVFPALGVKYSTQRKRADQSPAESIATGLASCTGLSIMLTNACRAVGVPARLAGIPNWVDKRGNHTWVEVWDRDWQFAGAAEPDGRGLNHAWFTADAALAQRDVAEHAIYAISYRRTGLEFPMVFDPSRPRAQAVNVTDRYAKPDATNDEETRFMLSVLGRDGKRAAAEVALRHRTDTTETYSGITRDETFDTNDLLSFTVRRGATYGLTVTLDDRNYAIDLTMDKPRFTYVLAQDAYGLFPRLPKPENAEAQLRTWFADPDTTFSADMDHWVWTNPAAARALAWQAYRNAPQPDLEADFKANRVRSAGHESPYVARFVGKRPAGGWPLVIAMHGGGGAPQEVNDRGWATMQRYYRDQPDLGGYIYLALRAPNNEWNGFYADYVYPLITRLVRQYTRFGDVDPDRVYLIGYSHGGYGAFSIGPKLPHRFAAIHASAAAPTAGDSVPRGLRTTPFSYMIGENDTAYGRKDRCLAFNEAVQALKGDRDDIYPVVLEFKEGFGHGGLPDRNKIRDLYSHVRNAHPREISWEMTDSVVRDHFWVSVPDAARGRIIEAAIDGYDVDLKNIKDVPKLTLHLDERLVNPRAPVNVNIGTLSLVCSPRPSMRELCRSIMERGDPQLSHTMTIEVDLEAMKVTPSVP